MGVYLNSKSPFGLFFDEAASVYYIDKSAMLLELLPLVEDGEEILEKGSAVAELTNNNLGNYWTSSGPYDEKTKKTRLPGGSSQRSTLTLQEYITIISV